MNARLEDLGKRSDKYGVEGENGDREKDRDGQIWGLG